MATLGRQASLVALRGLLAPIVCFSEESWAEATPNFQQRRFGAGTTILPAGARARELGFVISGLARYYYLTAAGKEFNKSFVGPGYPLASVASLVSGERSSFTIEALEPCVAAFIGYDVLLALCEAHRDWARLTRSLLERLALKKERREADFLLLSAGERYRQFLAEYGPLAGRIPNYHIASYLGITEVALSRIRRRLGMIGDGD